MCIYIHFEKLYVFGSFNMNVVYKVFKLLKGMNIVAAVIKALKKYTLKQKTFLISLIEDNLTCAASPKLGGNVRGKNIELV